MRDETTCWNEYFRERPAGDTDWRLFERLNVCLCVSVCTQAGWVTPWLFLLLLQHWFVSASWEIKLLSQRSYFLIHMFKLRWHSCLINAVGNTNINIKVQIFTINKMLISIHTGGILALDLIIIKHWLWLRPTGHILQLLGHWQRVLPH